jgi:hypothetical protein
MATGFRSTPRVETIESGDAVGTERLSEYVLTASYWRESSERLFEVGWEVRLRGMEEFAMDSCRRDSILVDDHSCSSLKGSLWRNPEIIRHTDATHRHITGTIPMVWRRLASLTDRRESPVTVGVTTGQRLDAE